MFCPKCGTKNPDDGKFCRSCGVDLGVVNAAMSGTLAPLIDDIGLDCSTGKSKRIKTADDIFSDAVRSIVSGSGFIVISAVLFLTNVANGQKWFWVFLFPAFTFLAKGVSEYAKARRMDQKVRDPALNAGQIGSGTAKSFLASPAAYAQPETRFKTGDLVPSSVTDGTTRNLELNSEGETMALPKH